MIAFSEKIINITAEAEKRLEGIFKKIDDVSFENTKSILDAFGKHRVSEAMFAPTSGYGYGDRGRETLDCIYADVFGCEAAIVRHNIVNGTQALTVGLFGLLRPGDILYSISGKPYDTLDEVIGNSGKAGNGSLRDFGVDYLQTELKNGGFDFDEIKTNLEKFGNKIKVVFIQRSKGYQDRRTLSVAEIGKATAFVKTLVPGCYAVVDNCYGEFCETSEPTHVGADLAIGSLIKNPGGGVAETGGYLAGTARAVELASYRLTSVGVGGEVGATLGQNKNMIKGLFHASSTTAAALKTAHLAAYIFSSLGLDVNPKWDEPRGDIIQAVRTGSPELMLALCRGIQAASPVDAPRRNRDMPGWLRPGDGR